MPSIQESLPYLFVVVDGGDALAVAAVSGILESQPRSRQRPRDGSRACCPAVREHFFTDQRRLRARPKA